MSFYQKKRKKFFFTQFELEILFPCFIIQIKEINQSRDKIIQTIFSPDSHIAPENPAGHVQVKPPMWSTHTALFRHGELEHSFISETTTESLLHSQPSYKRKNQRAAIENWSIYLYLKQQQLFFPYCKNINSFIALNFKMHLFLKSDL